MSIRLLPCRVAQPVSRVSGSITVLRSLNPTIQVGSADPSASQSMMSSRSIASSPPHGGATARIPGSRSMAVSSAARCSLGAEVTPPPYTHSPSTTS